VVSVVVCSAVLCCVSLWKPRYHPNPGVALGGKEEEGTVANVLLSGCAISCGGEDQAPPFPSMDPGGWWPAWGPWGRRGGVCGALCSGRAQVPQS